MFLSDRLQNRLNRRHRTCLQEPILAFLETWSNCNVPSQCYNALHALCKSFDAVGEYYDAEEIMSAGLIVLEDEPRRQAVVRQANLQRAQNDRALLKVGGMVVGGLLLCALFKR